MEVDITIKSKINIDLPILQPKYLFTIRAMISTPPVVPPFLKTIPSPIPINTPAKSAAKVISEYNGIEKEYRSEEHTSELQSRFDLVCRLLLEKKKNLD